MAESSTGAASDVEADLVGAMVEAIADAEGVEAHDVSPPIGRSVDLDALATFLESAPPDAHARFSYERWEIQVYANGTVDVVPAA